MTDEKRRSRRSLQEFRAGAAEHVPVHIGEVKVADGSSLLFTVGLGSCVAIALYDPDRRIGGLAHAMLPHPDAGRRDAPPGRFATTAVASLIDMMEDRGASRNRLRARLAGGASMFRDILDREGLKLGRRNVDAARDTLTSAGIAVQAEDVLGTYGRSVFLRTGDGQLLVTAVNHDDVFL
jgi:chemotaxis protein CheD